MSGKSSLQEMTDLQDSWVNISSMANVSSGVRLRASLKEEARVEDRTILTDTSWDSLRNLDTSLIDRLRRGSDAAQLANLFPRPNPLKSFKKKKRNPGQGGNSTLSSTDSSLAEMDNTKSENITPVTSFQQFSSPETSLSVIQEEELPRNPFKKTLKRNAPGKQLTEIASRKNLKRKVSIDLAFGEAKPKGESKNDLKSGGELNISSMSSDSNDSSYLVINKEHTSRIFKKNQCNSRCVEISLTSVDGDANGSNVDTKDAESTQYASHMDMTDGCDSHKYEYSHGTITPNISQIMEITCLADRTNNLQEKINSDKKNGSHKKISISGKDPSRRSSRILSKRLNQSEGVLNTTETGEAKYHETEEEKAVKSMKNGIAKASFNISSGDLSSVQKSTLQISPTAKSILEDRRRKLKQSLAAKRKYSVQLMLDSNCDETEVENQSATEEMEDIPETNSTVEPLEEQQRVMVPQELFADMTCGEPAEVTEKREIEDTESACISLGVNASSTGISMLEDKRTKLKQSLAAKRKYSVQLMLDSNCDTTEVENQTRTVPTGTIEDSPETNATEVVEYAEPFEEQEQEVVPQVLLADRTCEKLAEVTEKREIEVNASACVTVEVNASSTATSMLADRRQSLVIERKYSVQLNSNCDTTEVENHTTTVTTEELEDIPKTNSTVEPLDEQQRVMVPQDLLADKTCGEPAEESEKREIDDNASDCVGLDVNSCATEKSIFEDRRTKLKQSLAAKRKYSVQLMLDSICDTTEVENQSTTVPTEEMEDIPETNSTVEPLDEQQRVMVPQELLADKTCGEPAEVTDKREIDDNPSDFVGLDVNSCATEKSIFEDRRTKLKQSLAAKRKYSVQLMLDSICDTTEVENQSTTVPTEEMEDIPETNSTVEPLDEQQRVMVPQELLADKTCGEPAEVTDKREIDDNPSDFVGLDVNSCATEKSIFEDRRTKLKQSLAAKRKYSVQLMLDSICDTTEVENQSTTVPTEEMEDIPETNSTVEPLDEQQRVMVPQELLADKTCGEPAEVTDKREIDDYPSDLVGLDVNSCATEKSIFEDRRTKLKQSLAAKRKYSVQLMLDSNCGTTEVVNQSTTVPTEEMVHIPQTNSTEVVECAEPLEEQQLEVVPQVLLADKTCEAIAEVPEKREFEVNSSACVTVEVDTSSRAKSMLEDKKRQSQVVERKYSVQLKSNCDKTEVEKESPTVPTEEIEDIPETNSTEVVECGEPLEEQEQEVVPEEFFEDKTCGELGEVNEKREIYDNASDCVDFDVNSCAIGKSIFEDRRRKLKQSLAAKRKYSVQLMLDSNCDTTEAENQTRTVPTDTIEDSPETNTTEVVEYAEPLEEQQLEVVPQVLLADKTCEAIAEVSEKRESEVDTSACVTVEVDASSTAKSILEDKRRQSLVVERKYSVQLMLDSICDKTEKENQSTTVPTEEMEDIPQTNSTEVVGCAESSDEQQQEEVPQILLADKTCEAISENREFEVNSSACVTVEIDASLTEKSMLEDRRRQSLVIERKYSVQPTVNSNCDTTEVENQSTTVTTEEMEHIPETNSTEVVERAEPLEEQQQEVVPQVLLADRTCEEQAKVTGKREIEGNATASVFVEVDASPTENSMLEGRRRQSLAAKRKYSVQPTVNSNCDTTEVENHPPTVITEEMEHIPETNSTGIVSDAEPLEGQREMVPEELFTDKGCGKLVEVTEKREIDDNASDCVGLDVNSCATGKSIFEDRSMLKQSLASKRKYSVQLMLDSICDKTEVENHASIVSTEEIEDIPETNGTKVVEYAPHIEVRSEEEPHPRTRASWRKSKNESSLRTTSAVTGHKKSGNSHSSRVDSCSEKESTSGKPESLEMAGELKEGVVSVQEQALPEQNSQATTHNSAVSTDSSGTKLRISDSAKTRRGKKNRKSVTFSSLAQVKTGSQCNEVSLNDGNKKGKEEMSENVLGQSETGNLGVSIGLSIIGREGGTSPPRKMRKVYHSTPLGEGNGSERPGESRSGTVEPGENRNGEPGEGHVFLQPAPPNRTTRRRSGDRASISADTVNKKKRLSSLDKTINELSYEETLDMSEIPKDKTMIQRKKLIYHSTPLHPVAPGSRHRQKKNGSESLTTKTVGKIAVEGSELGTRNISVQVSKTIFGSSSEATSKSKYKDSNELSTSYSSLCRPGVVKRKTRSPEQQQSARKRFVSFAPFPVSESSSELATESATTIGSFRTSRRGTVNFAPVPIIFERSSTSNEKETYFLDTTSLNASQASSPSDSNGLENIREPIRFMEDVSDSEDYESGHGEGSDVGIVSSDELVSSDLAYEEPPPHSFGSDNQRPGLSSTIASSECTLLQEARRCIAEVEEAGSCLSKVTPAPRRSKVRSAPMFDGVPYEGTALSQPAPWVSDRLYNFLIGKLEPTFGTLEARLKSETVVAYLCGAAASCSIFTEYAQVKNVTLLLRSVLLRYHICTTYLHYCTFLRLFLPSHLCVKMIPLAGLFNSISCPTKKKSSDSLLDDDEVLLNIDL